MIIDSHVHLGRNEHISATAKQLLESMDKAKIDKALVFAGELNDCPNEWMLEQIAPHKDRLLGVAAYNHDKGGLFECTKHLLDMYNDGKIVAIKFYTGYEHFYPADKGDGVLAYLNGVGCPAIFHMGDCLSSVKRTKLKYAHPLLIDEVAVDYPNMNFIIAHAGNPWVKDAAEVCYKNDNVYADISGFVYGDFSLKDSLYFSKMIKEFLEISSSDKLLFGTDFPLANQDSYLQTLNDNFGEALTAQYLTQNIQKAFKLT